MLVKDWERQSELCLHLTFYASFCLYLSVCKVVQNSTVRLSCKCFIVTVLVQVLETLSTLQLRAPTSAPGCTSGFWPPLLTCAPSAPSPWRVLEVRMAKASMLREGQGEARGWEQARRHPSIQATDVGWKVAGRVCNERAEWPLRHTGGW